MNNILFNNQLLITEGEGELIEILTFFKDGRLHSSWLCSRVLEKCQGREPSVDKEGQFPLFRTFSENSFSFKRENLGVVLEFIKPLFQEEEEND